MAYVDQALDWLGHRIKSRVSCGPDPAKSLNHTDPARLRRVLRPGDVILVDGCDKVSAAIRYLTQSTWSHAAYYTGPVEGDVGLDGEPNELIEVNLGEGCVSASLSKYAYSPTRICRPSNLAAEDCARLTAFMRERIGVKYDLRNVLDLARYLIPQPPVPASWRRKMLAFGAGEPTRAICSTLIAQGFEHIGYPILPRVEKVMDGSALANGYTAEEIYHIRHYSLYTPRDFDVSPFFDVVKPTLAEGFNYKDVAWAMPQV
jgi:hypothetical protein